MEASEVRKARLEEAAKARRRRYHTNRAVVKNQVRQGSTIFVGGMPTESLPREAQHLVSSLVEHLETRADPKAMSLALDLELVVMEMRARGAQLSLM
jgi:hypothetical protein